LRDLASFGPDKCGATIRAWFHDFGSSCLGRQLGEWVRALALPPPVDGLEVVHAGSLIRSREAAGGTR